mgnify:CR=1 FL=1
MQDANVRNIDIEIEDAKRAIKRADMLDRLAKNADFQGLIEEGYFKEEASNIVIAKAIPHLREEKHQKIFDNRIIAIGELRQWLGEVGQQGAISRKALAEAESIRDEVIDVEE